MLMVAVGRWYRIIKGPRRKLIQEREERGGRSNTPGTTQTWQQIHNYREHQVDLTLSDMVIVSISSSNAT